MSWKCIFGFHDWRGGTCDACGKTRHQGWTEDRERHSQRNQSCPGPHDWSKNCEKCANCHKTRAQSHDWSKDCAKCAKCGQTRPKSNHQWHEDCETCCICGKKRHHRHDWNGCSCTQCPKKRNVYHFWDRCFCRRCFRKRDAGHEGHDWTEDCEKCRICGIERQHPHTWDAVNGWQCVKCEQVREDLMSTTALRSRRQAQLAGIWKWGTQVYTISEDLAITHVEFYCGDDVSQVMKDVKLYGDKLGTLSFSWSETDKCDSVHRLWRVELHIGTPFHYVLHGTLYGNEFYHSPYSTKKYCANEMPFLFEKCHPSRSPYGFLSCSCLEPMHKPVWYVENSTNAEKVGSGDAGTRLIVEGPTPPRDVR